MVTSPAWPLSAAATCPAQRSARRRCPPASSIRAWASPSPAAPCSAPMTRSASARVADRVAAGNIALLGPGDARSRQEQARLRNAIATGALLTSGRHLQHGDADQPSRNMEVFTNCATAAASFTKFYLLLNGSGVGRSYDDALMAVDWAQAPTLLLYLSPDHPDHPARDLARFADELGLPADPAVGGRLPRPRTAGRPGRCPGGRRPLPHRGQPRGLGQGRRIARGDGLPRRTRPHPGAGSFRDPSGRHADPRHAGAAGVRSRCRCCAPSSTSASM